jgi:RNA polymerase sigma factor (sigma-70 family)
LEYSTDHTFLEKLKQKDVLACKQLYLQYADAMYNLCIRILQHQAEAEDALQEAFIKIFNNIHQYRNESSIGSWMKQIVTNTCLNVLKKKKIAFDELKEDMSESESESDNEVIMTVKVKIILPLRKSKKQLKNCLRDTEWFLTCLCLKIIRTNRLQICWKYPNQRQKHNYLRQSEN